VSVIYLYYLLKLFIGGALGQILLKNLFLVNFDVDNVFPGWGTNPESFILIFIYFRFYILAAGSTIVEEQ
jgi:hypothetical protein